MSEKTCDIMVERNTRKISADDSSVEQIEVIFLQIEDADGLYTIVLLNEKDCRDTVFAPHNLWGGVKE